MTARVVIVGRWEVIDHADRPSKRSVAFVVTDDPDAVSWQEQIDRIARQLPRPDIQWEVLPIPPDTDEQKFFRSVA